MTKQVTNGTQEKNPGRSASHQRNGDDPHDGLGSLQTEGGQHENDQIRFNQGDSHRICSDSGRTNTSRKWTSKQASVGEILRRLKVIQEAYNSYVGSHQERLEIRLEESKDKQKHFTQEVEALEEEILALISEEYPEVKTEEPE